MVRVIAYLRPHKLEGVKAAVTSLGISGMSVADVRGTGASEEPATWFAGQETVVAMPIKSRLEMIVPADLAEPVVQAIVEHARTGEPGDGKIFLEPIEDAIRIRTLERGLDAV